MQYYPQAIKAECDFKSVLLSLGVDIKEDNSGKIHCFLPDHNDKTPSMKLFKDHAYCFSCNQSVDAIGAVEAVLEVGFREACEYLIKEFHLSNDCYELTPGDEGFVESEEDKMPLSSKDIKLLSLYRGIAYIKPEISYTPSIAEEFYQVPEEELSMKEKENRIGYGPGVRFSLRDLYKENKDGFYQLIQGKAGEAKEQLLEKKERNQNHFFDFVDKFGDKIKVFPKDDKEPFQTVKRRVLEEENRKVPYDKDLLLFWSIDLNRKEATDEIIHDVALACMQEDKVIARDLQRVEEIETMANHYLKTHKGEHTVTFEEEEEEEEEQEMA